MSRCKPALLLFEAAVTVTVVAVSLVFLTRSFGAGLRAMDQSRRYEATLRVAQQRMAELELEAELTQALSDDRRGELETPEGRFAWELAVTPFDAPHESLTENYALDRLTLSVAEVRDRAPVRLHLSTLMPRAWIGAGE